jgi:hypothetical protein
MPIMHSQKPPLSDSQDNEDHLLKQLDKKFEYVKTTLLDIQKDIELTLPLLYQYQGKEPEEAALLKVDKQTKKLTQKISLIEKEWQKSKKLLKETAETKERKLPSFTPKPKHLSPNQSFALLPSPSDKNIMNLNAALQGYHHLPSKKALDDIIEACNQYIESIPFSRRTKRLKETWGEVLPEWPYIERVFEIQKQAVSRLFLPDEKTDARKRLKLFREIVSSEQKSPHKAKILKEEFWGEYKFQGKKYIQAWLKNSNIETSSYLRSYREWIEYNNKLSDRDRNEVTYFQKPSKIVFKNGLAYLNDKLLNYSEEMIYVMGTNGEIHVSPKHETDYQFRHSSFLRGNKVLCAGTLIVKDGKIKLMTNKSGHYQPKRNHLLQVLEVMQTKHRLDLNEIVVKDLTRYDNDEEINALRFLKTNGFTLSDQNKFKRKNL